MDRISSIYGLIVMLVADKHILDKNLKEIIVWVVRIKLPPFQLSAAMMGICIYCVDKSAHHWADTLYLGRWKSVVQAVKLG